VCVRLTDVEAAQGARRGLTRYIHMSMSLSLSLYIYLYTYIYIYIYIFIYKYIYIYIDRYRVCGRLTNVEAAQGASRGCVRAWPLQDIVLLQGCRARINDLLCKHPLWLGTPPHSFTAHTIARYIVSPRHLFITIHTVQYW